MNQREPHLSCDDIDDAFRSLALFYGVTVDAVKSVYENSWPACLHSELRFCEFVNEQWVWPLGRYLNSESCNYDLPVCFYHRSRYNGNSNWFSDGLLNAQDGVAAFFTKLKMLSGWSDEFNKAESIALANIKERDGWANEHGPCAFDLLEHAKGANLTGLDYSMPEFFMGERWRNHSDLKASIVQFCTNELKPVVIKFVSKPENINLYICHLWLFLYTKKYGDDYTEPKIYSFNGKGAFIPRHAIIELIDIH